MLKRDITAIYEKEMTNKKIRTMIEQYGIAYVIDEQRKYLGCITKSDIKNDNIMLNRKSKVVIQGDDEGENAREIFDSYKIINNIPVVNENAEILYEYVREFHTNEYWEKRYKWGGTSGSGSYNRLAEFKADVINGFIKEKSIKSVIEWGCGDGNQLGMFLPLDYRGYDVSKTAVELCKDKYRDDTHKSFSQYDGEEITVEKADMSMSLDVIFHLIEDENFEHYMKNLFFSAEKYVCIYSNNADIKLATHVKGREFTKYVETNFPEWRLEKFVKNKYPYDAEDKENTSMSDFYFYKK